MQAPGWRRPAAALAAMLLAFGAAGGAVAQGGGTPSTEPAIVATRIDRADAPPLDGRLDHPVWQRAPVYDRFVTKAPRPGEVPAQRTEVRVLADDHALWVGVRAFERDLTSLVDPAVRHDGVNRTQDFVVVYVDAIGLRQSAQFFRLSAAGSTADGMHTAADDAEDFAPDFDWDGAVAREPGAWTAVLRLPFASLRYGRDTTSPWRVMVARRTPGRDFALDTSVLVPRGSASFIDRLQPLQGPTPPVDRALLVVRPGLTLRHEQPADGDGRTGWRASLDAKWRPRPELVVDATLRPDFSQLDLDVAPLAGNTRLALSLPEKRPFFFESSDILRTPTDALYTRSLTEPNGGLRATWRDPRQHAVALGVVDRGGASVLLPSAYGTDGVAQPASQALVLRWQQATDALAPHAPAFGGLGTLRRYADGAGTNAVAGPDVVWRIDDVWRVRAQALLSRTDAQPVALPDGRRVLGEGATTQGSHVAAKFWRQTDRQEIEALVERIGAGFRHDTGFVPQADIARIDTRFAWSLPKPSWLHESWFNLEARAVRTESGGELVQRELVPWWWFTGPSNLDGWIAWHPVDAARAAPGAPLVHPRHWKAGATLSPAPWLPTLSASVRVGRILDAQTGLARRGDDGNVSALWRPLRTLEVEPRFGWARLRDETGELAYRETVARLLAVWHVAPRQTLRLIVQRAQVQRASEATGGLGAVDAVDRRLRTRSLTYGFRPTSGSQLYIGLVDDRRSTLPRPAREAFVKLQVDIDDAQRWIARGRERAP